jgi:UDP-2,3-diacylglucosamine pyrophosphatase LpxH
LRKKFLNQGSEACNAILEITKRENPNLIFLLGDLLHTHEMVYVKAFRMLEDLIDNLRKIAQVHILVGNHDFVNASENQTKEHPFGPFKKWKGVYVHDRVEKLCVRGYSILVSPYIPYGHFLEAIEPHSDSDILLAHQPIDLVDPKAEPYPLEYPVMFSGHIHEACDPQENVHYIGSSLQVNKDEPPDKFFCVLYLDSDSFSYEYQKLPIKSMVYKKVNFEDINYKELHKLATNHILKLTIVATKEQKESLEAHRGYLNLKFTEARITWETPREKINLSLRSSKKRKSFKDILQRLVENSDLPTKEAYASIYGVIEPIVIFT